MQPAWTSSKYAARNKDTSSCEPAEAALTKAYSSSPTAHHRLQHGQGELCQRAPSRRKYPSRFTSSPARRSPILAGWKHGPEAVETYLTTIYTNFHGADDDGLKQLKELAAKSPLRRPISRSNHRPKSPGGRKKNSRDQSAACAVDGIKGQLADTNASNTSRDPERRRCERERAPKR